MEHWLPLCLSSFLVEDQRLAQLEVLVVNDGSHDRTGDIAREYAKRYPCVFRVIDKPNGNYGSCINAALPLVKGYYVKIVDADDRVDTEIFSRFLAELEEERSFGASAADLVLTDAVPVFPDGGIGQWGRTNYPYGRGLSLPDSSVSYVQFGLFAITFRTAIFHGLGYRQTEGISYTDMEWIIEPMVHVRHVSRYPLVVVKHLVGRPGQTTESQAKIAAHFSDYERIALDMISHYDRFAAECDHLALSYYKSQLLQLLLSIFEKGLFGMGNGIQVQVDLRSIDHAIRASRQLFLETEQAAIWSRWFPIRLIRAWRRHPGLGTPLLYAYRIFLSIKRIYYKWNIRCLKRCCACANDGQSNGRLH